MAYADYYLCDLCGGKTFYDAELHYNSGHGNPKTGHPWPAGVGDMAVLCKECCGTHKVEIVSRTEKA